MFLGAGCQYSWALRCLIYLKSLVGAVLSFGNYCPAARVDFGNPVQDSGVAGRSRAFQNVPGCSRKHGKRVAVEDRGILEGTVKGSRWKILILKVLCERGTTSSPTITCPLSAAGPPGTMAYTCPHGAPRLKFPGVRDQMCTAQGQFAKLVAKIRK